jgi:hypothetical protein
LVSGKKKKILPPNSGRYRNAPLAPSPAAAPRIAAAPRTLTLARPRQKEPEPRNRTEITENRNRTSLTPFMVEALVCTNDWVRRATPINVAENTEELAKLEEGDSINHLFYLLFVLTNKLFIAFISLISELIKEFKDKEINENNASKSQVLGSKSKATTTSTKTKSHSKQSSKTSKMGSVEERTW